MNWRYVFVVTFRSLCSLRGAAWPCDEWCEAGGVAGTSIWERGDGGLCRSWCKQTCCLVRNKILNTCWREVFTGVVIMLEFLQSKISIIL